MYGFCGLLARSLLPSEPGASTSASSHEPEPASRARDGARSAVLVAGHPAELRLRIVGLERSADADAELSILNQVRGL